MAMDNTPPRNRLIALYSALAVVTLMALKPAFDAYYDRMVVGAAEQHLDDEGWVTWEVSGAPDEARAPIEAALTSASGMLERCYDMQRARAAEDDEDDVREARGTLAYSLSAAGARPAGEPGIRDSQLVECVNGELEGLRVEAAGAWSATLVLGFARTQGLAYRQIWEAELAQPRAGGTKISDVMARLATGGRMAEARIRPMAAAQMDLDPLRGWAQLPQPLPRIPSAEPEPVPAEVVPAEGVPAEGVPVEGAPAEGAEGVPAEGAPAEGQPAEAPAPPPEPTEAAPAPRRPAPAAEEPAPRPRRPAAPAAEEEAPRPRRPRAPAAEGEPAPRARRPAAEAPARPAAVPDDPYGEK